MALSIAGTCTSPVVCRIRRKASPPASLGWVIPRHLDMSPGLRQDLLCAARSVLVKLRRACSIAEQPFRPGQPAECRCHCYRSVRDSWFFCVRSCTSQRGSDSSIRVADDGMSNQCCTKSVPIRSGIGRFGWIRADRLQDSCNMAVLAVHSRTARS
jgi:hypothetical protein